MKKSSLYFCVALLIIIIDQWSKIYVFNNFYIGESVRVIDGFFNLTYVKNSGAAFGFGGEFSDWIRFFLFKILPLAACVWISLLVNASAKKNEKLLTWSYSLILGGAIGNLIDRFRLDFVVDFFDFYYGSSHFATFNVADSAITVAAGLLIIDFFVQKKKEINSKAILKKENE